jgi:hypothetical protein
LNSQSRFFQGAYKTLKAFFGTLILDKYSGYNKECLYQNSAKDMTKHSCCTAHSKREVTALTFYQS